MGRTANITGVMTQGHLSYGSPRRPYYLKRFSLDFKNQDGEEWVTYNIDGKDVTFDGNNDTETIVTNILPEPVLASAVRFHPAGWHSNGFALRVEILGCSVPAMASSEPPVPIATTALPLPAKTTVEAAVAAEATTVHDLDSSGWTMGYRGATADDDTITVVAGSILGCVVLLIAILVCVLLYKRRKMIGSPETEADHRYDNVISYSRVLEESTLDQSEDGNLEWNNFYESVEGRGNGAEYACIQDNKEDNEKLEVENDLYQSSGI
ncbi:uncharacterized protein LOC118418891 [Branchiostoma floridae]|uniref:Uncharacterized protein LOC118418891 n=1 Tax=Branchiostoma floridae TaxID=7739 RepID=A0A9J7MUZ1_BRAFL|nr:uncharacterized protein LOC118418891 [Branchiostoma floridae]